MIKLFKLVTLLFLLLTGYTVSASERAESKQSHSTISVTFESNGWTPGAASWLAIKLSPETNWHTYWENFGDSGAAPIFFWTVPNGVNIGKPKFQVPSRIPVGPLMNYGYLGPSTILVPITFDKALASGKKTIQLSAEWLVCEVECIPQFADLSFDLEQVTGKDPQAVSLFSQARAKIPSPSFWYTKMELFPKDAVLTVFANRDDFDGDISDAYFFPLSDGVADYAAPQTWLWFEDGLKIQITRPEGSDNTPGVQGVLKLTTDDGTEFGFTLKPELSATNLETRATGLATPDEGQFSIGLPLWQALVFAFLGGVILNLMPCVFPVLSLKVIALAKSTALSKQKRRLEGWSYTAGIWISFMVIVLILAILKAGGEVIGWGFQLQSPAFIAFLAAIILLVALSLFGMFDIETGLEGSGDSLTKGQGLKASFFKGVLATLVATPCTAPLMAPAIGFALTQSIVINLVIFSALAFGMASPFLALSYSDTVAKWMPKPGNWMVTMKQVLAFPMLLTLCWLVYVYSMQTDEASVFILLIALTLLTFSVWLWQISKGVLLKIGAVIILASATYAVALSSATSPKVTQATETNEVFSEEKLQTLIAAGKPVFVYFTADWCITCKVNEKTVLQTTEIENFFADNNISVLKADWTNRNEMIARILAKHNRAGVPMYLFYPSGSDTPVLLPELLTKSIVIDTLQAGA